MRLNRLNVALILLCMMALAMPVSLAKEEPAELQGESVKIQDIIQNVAAFSGKNVAIEGKIETECPAGCWFIVETEAQACISISFPATSSYPRRRV